MEFKGTHRELYRLHLVSFKGNHSSNISHWHLLCSQMHRLDPQQVLLLSYKSFPFRRILYHRILYTLDIRLRWLYNKD